MRNRFTILIALVAIASASIVATSVAGISGLDRSFGDRGRAITRFGVDTRLDFRSVDDLALGADGRIAVVGRPQGATLPITIAMLNPDGTPDSAFGDDGILQPQLDDRLPLRSNKPTQIAFTPSGALLLAGSAGSRKEPGLALARLLPDGSVDTSFGRDGFVRASEQRLSYRVKQLYVQPAGEIMLFGYGDCVDCGFKLASPRLARYTADGKPLRVGGLGGLGLGPTAMGPDGSFLAVGGTGNGEPGESLLIRLSPAGEIEHQTKPVKFVPGGNFGVVALQADGRALFANEKGVTRLEADDETVDAGFAGAPSPCLSKPGVGFRFEAVTVDASQRVLAAGACGVIRLESDGTADLSFGNAGVAGPPLGNAAIAFGADDSTVYARPVEAGWQVGRILSDGQPDASFGEGGQATLAASAPRAAGARALAAGPHRTLVAAGRVRCADRACTGFALARYLRDGRLDRSFGGDGRAVVSGHSLNGADAVAVTHDGSVVASGTTFTVPSPSGDTPEAFALVKVNRHGRLDRRFGDDGIATTHVVKKGEERRSEAKGVAIQPDGKIVVAGLADGCPNLCFVVARYLPNGKLDRRFANGGFFARYEKGAYATAVAIQPDGRIVATGGSYGYSVTVRLTGHGRLDRSFGGDGVVSVPHVIRHKRPSVEVVDLSIAAKALALGPRGSITVAGGGGQGWGFVERFRRDGRIDRSFGRSGAVSLPSLSITGLALTRCGVVATGLTHTGGAGVMGVVGISAGGKVQRGPVRHPFGSSLSIGNALVSRGWSIVSAGRLTPIERGGEFALASLRIGALLPSCPR